MDELVKLIREWLPVLMTLGIIWFLIVLAGVCTVFYFVFKVFRNITREFNQPWTR